MDKKKSKSSRSLDSCPFAFTETAQGLVKISYQGKPVITLAASAAAKFLSRAQSLSDTGDTRGLQLLMAKATGNFKRGNERPTSL